MALKAEELNQQFIDYFEENHAFIENIFDNEEIMKAVDAIMMKQFRKFGQIDPRVIAAFGLFIASDYERITGTEMPFVFQNFVDELRSKEL